MLTSLRELLRSKWVGGLVFGLIIVSMALWIDLPSLAGGMGNQAVQAGSRSFTMQEFDTRLEQVLRRQRQQGGVATRREAVERGIVDQLFAAETARTTNLGYGAEIGAAASEGYSTARVLADQNFVDPVSGAFNADLYRQILRTNQFTPALYEQNLRDTRTLGTLVAGIEGGLDIPAGFSELQATYLAESREVTWLVVDGADGGGVEPPSDEALGAFFAEETAQFSVPERRVLSILTLSPSDFLHTVEVSPEDLRALYETQKTQRFSGPERRRFLEVAATSETAALDAFGRLAGGASPDTFTGGDIASAQPRTALQAELTNPELTEALFDQAARPGAVVGPFQTGNVWLVARLDEVIPGTPLPFESVSTVIKEEFAAREAENLFLQAESQLFQLIGQGLSLKEIGAELGAPVLTYLPLSAGAATADGVVIPDLAANRPLMDAAFSGRVGDVTDPVEGDTQVALIEVQEVLAPYTPNLADIRSQVEAAYTARESAESLQRFASALVEDIQAGTRTLTEVAEGLGKPLQSAPRPISRANYDGALPQQLLVPVFEASQGDVFTLPGPGPNQMLLAELTAITPPEAVEIEVLSGLVGPELEESVRDDFLSAMESGFRDTLDLDANRAALEAYKRQILDQQ